MNYEAEIVYKIHMEEGEVIEIGSDPDGLGCIEIRHLSNGKIIDRITVQKDIAREIAKGIGILGSIA